MTINGVKREIQRLRRKLVEDEKESRAAAPTVDEDGLPMWDGTPALSPGGYTRVLGELPDEELTEAELEARHRLSPFRAVFERLDREKAEVGT